MNLKQFQRRNIITDVAGLIFFQNRDILYTVSTEAIISCPMKFSAYPLDYQVCPPAPLYFMCTCTALGRGCVNARAFRALPAIPTRLA